MGTHPIFESDFDCLTEWRQKSRQLWRKRFKLRKNAARKFSENAMPLDQAIKTFWPGLILKRLIRKQSIEWNLSKKDEKKKHKKGDAQIKKKKKKKKKKS